MKVMSLALSRGGRLEADVDAFSDPSALFLQCSCILSRGALNTNGALQSMSHTRLH